MTPDFQPLSWCLDSNIYEVNLRQYTHEGTFQAFAAHLPRLRNMGVEILWFMPITPISYQGRLGSLGSYYACSDYTTTNPEFGSVADFRDLVHQAQALGFKVIIDWVANHTGWDHRWTREHPEFYRRNLEGNFYDAHGWQDVIDLNYDVPGLRDAMIESMLFWIDQCGVDGFRCDMAMLVPLGFWKTARETLDRRKKLFWLAECEDPAYHPVFDVSYAWKMLHKMEDYGRGTTNIHGLIEVLDYYREQFIPQAMRTLFTSNHDENSHSGTEFERMGPAAVPFAVLCCTWTGLPMIYSGQEIPSHKRLKFFDKDELEWPQQCQLETFYRKLLDLRKTNPAFRSTVAGTGPSLLANSSPDQVMVFIRSAENGKALILLNLSGDTLAPVLYNNFLSGSFRDVFTEEIREINDDSSFPMGPWEYRVLAQ